LRGGLTIHNLKGNAMHEATTVETPYGRYITTDGWFVLNLSDALALQNEQKGGASYPLESQEHPFASFGVHVRVLPAGEPNALYHSEGAQEGFLVLSGTCTLLVEEQERDLRQWDYVHCPAGARHVFIGKSPEPCTLLMIGARPDEPIRFPASKLAHRFNASAPADTDDPEQAYAQWPGDYTPTRLPWPPAPDTAP
jgi:uncharacterized cupin superfamily protein